MSFSHIPAKSSRYSHEWLAESGLEECDPNEETPVVKLERLRSELATKRRALKEADADLGRVDWEPQDWEQARGEIDSLVKQIAELTK